VTRIGTKRFILLATMLLSFLAWTAGIFIEKANRLSVPLGHWVGPTGSEPPPQPPTPLPFPANSSTILTALGATLALFSVLWEGTISRSVIYSALSGALPFAFAFLFWFAEAPSFSRAKGFFFLDAVFLILMLSVAIAQRSLKSRLERFQGLKTNGVLK
jgi:hypothetical protein